MKIMDWRNADLLGENIAEVKEVIGGRIEEAILRDERFNSVEIESISNYKRIDGFSDSYNF